MKPSLLNQRFGRLAVIGKGPWAKHHQLWQCACDCGAQVVVSTSVLRGGVKRSCGCLRREVSARRAAARATHGLVKHPIYNLWRGMVRRCTEPTNKDFHKYGGRGITVCQRWLESVNAFLEDMGPRPAGKSLDRIDNDGPYSPDNCRWATNSEQSRNRRNNVLIEFAGERLSVCEWAERTGLTPISIYHRLRFGWTAERALTTPLRQTRAKAHIAQEEPK